MHTEEYHITPGSAVPLAQTQTRDQWLEQRRHGIGSSDASAILGLSTFASPYNLWEEKTGKIPLDIPVSNRTAELMEWGNRLEPLILNATRERTGLNIVKPIHAYRHATREWQHSNLDGVIPDSSPLTIAEFKNTDSRNIRQWIGQVPDHAEIQVHHSAAVFGAAHAIIAGLVGGNRLIIHTIDINPNIVEMVTEAETKFWDYVQRDTPPPIDGHIKTLQALTREWAHRPGVKEIPAEQAEPAWEEWAMASADEKAARARKQQAVARLAALMDGYDEIATGKHTWAKTQGGQLNMKRLTAEHRDLVSEFTRPAPKFDLDRFKAEQSDLYTKYQYTTIRPTKEN